MDNSEDSFRYTYLERKLAGIPAKEYDQKTHVDETKKLWLRRQQIYRDMYYGKSKLPPMSIEPLPLERQRLPFKMTPEERGLRQQWLRDQILSPNEPRHVPELRPRNFIRRAMGLPWDVATKFVISTLGMDHARNFRYFAPKVAMYILGLCTLATYLEHNRSTWERVQGWNIYKNKLPLYPGEPIPENPVRDYHEKSQGDFYDKGFSKRTSHLSLS